MPTHRYVDPLDRVWQSAAERIGLSVRRSPDAYASTPGDGDLILGDQRTLDPDDSIAQMVFHELCHSLVEGESSFERRDWGLDNENDRDEPRERACLRLQAFLASRYGLRRFLAPTTDFRDFYDSLGPHPLDPARDPTISMAISAVRRAERPPWAPHLEDALEATRAIVDAVLPFAEKEPRRDLFELVDPRPPKHPTGLPGTAEIELGRTCGNCAWRIEGKSRCRLAGGARVQSDWRACERWQAELDCRSCAACCRSAYDLVQVSRRDPVRKKHPDLVVARGPFLEIRRLGGNCAALAESSEGSDSPAHFTCSIYAERPRSCGQFERQGEHCLTARRRLGLTV